MAYGLAIANQSGKLSIPGWKVMFIFLGALTAACGVILAIFLPDSPLNARFLRPDEREMAVERIRGNQQGIGNKEFKLYQVKEAFTDPLVGGDVSSVNDSLIELNVSPSTRPGSTRSMLSQR